MKNTVLKKIVLTALIAVIIASCVLTLCACNNNDNNNNENTANTDNEYKYFDKNTRFDLSLGDSSKYEQYTNVMDLPAPIIMMIRNAALDMGNCYAEFKTDGTVHCQIQTKKGFINDVKKLLTLMKIDLEEFLSDFSLTVMLNNYVEPMFPGFTAKFSTGDVGGAMGLVERSLGLNLKGLDLNDPDIKALFDEMGETMTIPADILDRIPTDAVLTLTFDSTYNIRELTTHDGKKRTGIYVSEIGKSHSTQPYCVFSLVENEGVRTLFFRAEFMMTQVYLTETNK